jgi:hypothetical protein
VLNPRYTIAKIAMAVFAFNIKISPKNCVRFTKKPSAATQIRFIPGGPNLQITLIGAFSAR